MMRRNWHGNVETERIACAWALREACEEGNRD